MRLLTLVDTFFPDAPGGMARVAWDVAKAMARRGHEVGVVAGFANVPEWEGELFEERIDEVRVFRYPKPVMSAWDPYRAQKQIQDGRRAFLAAADRFPCDLVHCHSIYTAAAACGPPTTPPIVRTIHSPGLQELLYNWKQKGIAGSISRLLGRNVVRRLERRGLLAAAALHTLSRFTTTEIQRDYPEITRGYEVIPHWADQAWYRTVSKSEARKRLGWPQGETIVFTVRQLRHRYGLDTAIDAIGPLAAAGRCIFFLAGSGSDHSQLESQIQRLGVGQRVKLLGRISDEDLRLAYQAADLFVLPTRALECFGLIILEALACGLPVIATDVGAIPETVRPILSEFLVPPDNPLAMRQKVAAFLDEVLVPPPSSELVAYTRQNFGEQEVVDRYESFFQRACSS